MYKEAALKAWRTIRRKKREEAAEGVEKLDNWIDVESINNIQHPEISDQEEEEIWEGNGVVKLFSKTPDDIACGPFWEIRWAYGCPLDCSYCYLRGTMRGKLKPSYVRIEEVKKCIIEAFEKIKSPQLFNSGELCDSLMNPSNMVEIVDIFETQNKHKIYLLSKFGLKNIGFLLEKKRKQTICAWSINAEPVSKLWEKSAAKPVDRIRAASLVWEEGYDTRIRFDPIFPIKNWKKHYDKIINNVFSELLPNRIILGTPRGLWKTIHYAKLSGTDMEWSNFFAEDSGWGKKLSFDQRKEIYSFFYEKLESLGYPIHKVSICKETREMWNYLGCQEKSKLCNCYGPEAFS
jgi:spore photoproduct lyase